jgi:8-oxo-dGTP diphosphatase
MADAIVTGVIVKDGRILLCHRSEARQWNPNVWDLPGGHIELGESPTEALRRELREELGIVVNSLSQQPLDRLRGPDLEMDIYAVLAWDGTPVNLAPEEHDAIEWFAAEDLPGLKMGHDSYLSCFIAALRA